MDEEWLSWNRQGWIPGPGETRAHFIARRAAASTVVGDGVHVTSEEWKDSQELLGALFDLEPKSFVAFYSDRNLMPWQGAVSWMGSDGTAWIQLRSSFRDGRYRRLYARSEVLAHEAVHVARSAFQEPKWEELFAYRTSRYRWRRWLGPCIESPWEVWLFFWMLIGSEVALIGTHSWLGMSPLALLILFAMVRRGWREWILYRAKQTVAPLLRNPHRAEAVLMRLSDAEIRSFARWDRQSVHSYIHAQGELRWALLRAAYF